MTSVIKVIYKGKTLVLTDLYNDYSIAKNKKQTYIPKICSIFNLTEECMFDIIQAERTNVPEQIFLCEVCYESTEERIPYDGQRVKII